MYSRAYGGSGEDRIPIPERYGGTAFSEGGKDDNRRSSAEVLAIPADTATREAKISPREPIPEPPADSVTGDCEEVAAKQGFRLAPFLKNLIPKSLLPRGGGFSLDLEDLLIIGIAVFLFLSRDGDRELALMLALLVFIS